MSKDNVCPYCFDEFPSSLGVSLHAQKYCRVLLTVPKEPCLKGCLAYHVHEMQDGKWAVFFDDMPQQTGFKTKDGAEKALLEMVAS